MPTSQIDVTAQLRAFPYVSPPSLGADTGVSVDSLVSDQESPDVDVSTPSPSNTSGVDAFIASLESGASQIPDDISDLIGPGAPTPAVVGQDEWESVSMADLSWVEKITSPLESALGKIDKIVTVLNKVLKIIELFSSTFNSFSKLIISAIELAQNKLNEYDIGGMAFGVHANVIVPPALLKLVGDVDSRNQLRGGFEGFLTRLESSVNNVQDINRPQYSTNDYVGGMIILLDSESLDTIWTGLKQLASMFDFMSLFTLNLAPPPPTNLVGFSGRFSYDNTSEEYETQTDITRKEESDSGSSKEWKFGVQLEWDQTYTSSGFNIYRSRVQGGSPQLVEYTPTSLVDNKETGDPGLLSLVWDWVLNIKAKESVQRPEKLENVYSDPDFSGPVYVPAGFNSRLKYVDTNMTTKVLNPGSAVEDQVEVPIIKEGDKEILVTNYYYIIRACDSNGMNEGPNSKELSVAIKACNDAFSIADLIQHPNGRFEFFSTGYGKINSWSSIQVSSMIPWFGEIINILDDFLETLKGMATSASESYSDFLDQIQAKVQMYTNILGAVSYLVSTVKDLLLTPSVSYLNVPPEKGGMQVFLQRVRNAQGGDEFSGSDGITVGIVLTYGGSVGKVALIKRVFNFIYSLFVDN